MMLQQIENVILEAKKLPNSESKNRILSHLKDARAHIIVEMSEYSSFALERNTNDINGQKRHINDVPSLTELNRKCICPAGAIDTECTIHAVHG